MILEAAGLLIAAPRPGHGPTSSPRARHAQHAIPATHSSHTAAQSRLTSKSRQSTSPAIDPEARPGEVRSCGRKRHAELVPPVVRPRCQLSSLTVEGYLAKSVTQALAYISRIWTVSGVTPGSGGSG